MAIFFGIYIAVGIIVVIVAMLLAGMRGRGRLIECPECGARFKRPAFAQKRSGIGFSFPGIGDFTCPKCKYKASTSNFGFVDKNVKRAKR